MQITDEEAIRAGKTKEQVAQGVAVSAIEVFAATVPRAGWRFRCWQCKRETGTYQFKAQCDEDGAAHTEHRCPGPWLLETDREIPTVWNSKVVLSAWTRKQETLQQANEARGGVSDLHRTRLR